MKVQRGETFRRVLAFKDGEGQPADLSGCTAFSQVRPEPDAEELICFMETAVIPETGTVRLSVSAETTAGLEPGNYAYDFALQMPSGEVRYYLGGIFSVLPSVTVVSVQ